MDFVHSGALQQSFIHLEMPFAGRGCQHGEKLFLGFGTEFLQAAKTVAAGLQAADGLLESFLIGFADAHDLADRAHLSAELVLHALEFLKGPAGELDDHVISVRHVFVQRAIFSAGDILQGQAAGEHGGNESNGEARRLGCQSGGAGGAGIDLDDDDPIRFRVVGKLHVGAADDLNALHDFVSRLLEALLTFFGNGEHGSGTEGIARVYTHGINVFDEADGDHIVVRVTYHFKLQLFPAEDGFLYQNLSYQAGLKTSGADGFQFVHIVNQAAARAAHGIGGTKHHRISQTVRDGQSFFHAVGNLTPGHFDSQRVHRILEFDPVLAPFDGVHLNADNLHIVFIQHACLAQLRAEVQAGLPAQVGKQGVGTLLGDDLFEALHIQRLNVGNIGGFRVGHDGGRVGIDQHDLIAELF